MADVLMKIKPVEHDAGFLFEIMPTRRAAHVSHKPLRRRLRAIGFLAHLHCLPVTMKVHHELDGVELDVARK